MKILYGVQGTGNGHIARARVMAKAMAKREEIEVDFIFSGRAPEDYFDMQVFGNYRALSGLTFVTENGCVNRWKTLQQAKLKQLVKDVRSLDLCHYDVLLNDFDPVTAWAAKISDLASISVSHQAAFKHKIPKQGQTLTDRILTRLFAPCDIHLGVHWYHFGFPIMPPFIEETVDAAIAEEKILVYLPFENINDIQQLFAQFPQLSFECYHPEIKQARRNANIQWKALSKAAFQQSLFRCCGVIANGGFELASECLQLGKKILIKPLQNQYEQSSNVLTLERMQRCLSMPTLDPKIVDTWLTQPSPQPIRYPNNPDIFIDWLLDESWEDTKELCDQLWSQTHFPDDVTQGLVKLTSPFSRSFS
ncbi:MJ1255/VC2487 family glycosyltransferase [Aliiglaciecola sp. LCG003]|uniref:MJ1255/VC2487 family glycosyltransferase n=1 Tax=Aliiglaciecola sp. LCG003 TaxID=3053655 RepID=UPI0025728DE6|nr:MJ1255/VC2487 family glycosyltransferase [Aliiglaciecola sp. LCG003]WJG09665.1 glycosyltransferase family protein [Aliiglaciecola sp. LCG003]